jgi:hypothetical protein
MTVGNSKPLMIMHKNKKVKKTSMPITDLGIFFNMIIQNILITTPLPINLVISFK